MRVEKSRRPSARSRDHGDRTARCGEAVGKRRCLDQPALEPPLSREHLVEVVEVGDSVLSQIGARCIGFGSDVPKETVRYPTLSSRLAFCPNPDVTAPVFGLLGELDFFTLFQRNGIVIARLTIGNYVEGSRCVRPGPAGVPLRQRRSGRIPYLPICVNVANVGLVEIRGYYSHDPSFASTR